MRSNAQPDSFTPALGKHWLTPFYDVAVALTTREGAWRTALVENVDPKPGECIVDVGCGTATLGIAMMKQQPLAKIIGVDPDPNVLTIAARKAAKANVEIAFVQAYGDAMEGHVAPNSVDKIFSGLMLHHVTTKTKLSIFKAAYQALKPSGLIVIADFGKQKSWVAKSLFRLIQALDGFETTQPNADGILPTLMADAGFSSVREEKVIFTPVGTISLYMAQKPAG
jgi:ubiquinone/menaquinone biosynthesis C-methylase UbiE